VNRLSLSGLVASVFPSRSFGSGERAPRHKAGGHDSAAARAFQPAALSSPKTHFSRGLRHVGQMRLYGRTKEEQIEQRKQYDAVHF
jgi:hypothetical protein